MSSWARCELAVLVFGPAYKVPVSRRRLVQYQPQSRNVCIAQPEVGATVEVSTWTPGMLRDMLPDFPVSEIDDPEDGQLRLVPISPVRHEGPWSKLELFANGDQPAFGEGQPGQGELGLPRLSDLRATGEPGGKPFQQGPKGERRRRSRSRFSWSH